MYGWLNREAHVQKLKPNFSLHQEIVSRDWSLSLSRERLAATWAEDPPKSWEWRIYIPLQFVRYAGVRTGTAIRAVLITASGSPGSSAGALCKVSSRSYKARQVDSVEYLLWWTVVWHKWYFFWPERFTSINTLKKICSMDRLFLIDSLFQILESDRTLHTDSNEANVHTIL